MPPKKKITFQQIISNPLIKSAPFTAVLWPAITSKKTRSDKWFQKKTGWHGCSFNQEEQATVIEVYNELFGLK